MKNPELLNRFSHFQDHIKKVSWSRSWLKPVQELTKPVQELTKLVQELNKPVPELTRPAQNFALNWPLEYSKEMYLVDRHKYLLRVTERGFTVPGTKLNNFVYANQFLYIWVNMYGYLKNVMSINIF